MARPIADELAAHPGRYNLSSLFIVGSGGALLSPAVREQLQGLLPNVYITDRFGASESGTDGELGGPSSTRSSPARRTSGSANGKLPSFTFVLASRPLTPTSCARIAEPRSPAKRCRPGSSWCRT
jgi:acyl-coenzyme A synthetase/AMP-(fatty) acid ligase